MSSPSYELVPEGIIGIIQAFSVFSIFFSVLSLSSGFNLFLFLFGIFTPAGGISFTIISYLKLRKTTPSSRQILWLIHLISWMSPFLVMYNILFSNTHVTFSDSPVLFLLASFYPLLVTFSASFLFYFSRKIQVLALLLSLVLSISLLWVLLLFSEESALDTTLPVFSWINILFWAVVLWATRLNSIFRRPLNTNTALKDDSLLFPEAKEIRL